MSKIIFLGTDLHGEKSELAAKLVNDLRVYEKSTIVSIKNRKPWTSEKRTVIIPSIFINYWLRRLVQGFLLPVYLLFLRKNHNKIFSFWVADKPYHSLLFAFLKLIGYEINFTVISGYNMKYSSLKNCNRIICQSEKMYFHIKKIFPNKKIILIHPWTELKYKNSKRIFDIIVPSVPYKIENFEERGMFQIINLLKTSDLESVIIFRSDEAYNYFKNQKLKNTKMINKVLKKEELEKIMSLSKVMPLIYTTNNPDMPLSAIEGLACGCTIVCTENLGISSIIKKEKCGIVMGKEINPETIKKAIILAIKLNNNMDISKKYFDKEKNINRYKVLY